jgi:YD repeat-containing protein
MFTRQIKIAFILACVLTASCVSYSFASDNPVISEGPYIGSRHWGNNTEEEYSISCWLRISDPQGLDNIASVVANFPDGSFYAELFDDGNHCDDAPGDGGYGVCGNGMASPPPLGEYSIVVTDKDGNTVSGSTTVEHFLDFPTVFSPASGSVITNPQPAFTWNAVQGAVRYSLEIVNPENWELMWRQDDITGTSVTYNNDGTGQSLTEDILYRWGVSAWDDKENGSWHHTQISFIYSSDTEKPVMTDPIVRSRHWVGEPWESWGIDFWTNIGDLQGLNTIDSVWVEGPGDIRYELYDDGVHFDELANDGKFANWIGDLNEPPALGVYTFNVKDKSGNIVSATDTLTAVLDAPGNVMPVNDTIVSEQDVLFQWDAVPGAAWYEVQVTDQSWQHTFWSSGRELTQTSVRYNENGTGEDLTEGGLYKLVVRAGDGKNESERIIERIAYRASGQPGTIHVDISNTSGSEDGSSAHPFNTIQEGIDAAVSGDTVLVKSGTYVENISFNGKNITVQSAEGAEKTIIDGNKNGSVVGFWSGEGTTAILDGFTIRNGLTDGGGGGIDCGNSNPTLQNLIIKNNAAHDGGGINCYRSSPLMENLVISDNSAIWAAGGVHCTENSSPNILNATITGNSARFGGGITLWYESSPILRNVRIFENTAYNNGGGVNIDRNCNPSISNTTIAGNLSHQLGGGLSCFNGSAPNLENVTISGNLSEYGGGIYIGESDLTITNSISWNNTPQEIFFESWNIPASISVAYSDIQGGEAAIFRNGDVTINWSGGNIDSHPAFVNPSVLDYRLQSASPCINAGNPAAAYNDKDGTRNDMGAYGGPGGESYAYQDGPPSVEDVTITPSVAYPGTDVVITANVRDAVSGVKSVKAEIKRPNETLVGTINLYDDGLHNDGIAGDGIYGNSWTTPSGEDAYDIDITASDTQSHTADYKKAGTFSTQTIYDDFESAPIDLAKWEEYEQVREISDGKLHLNVQGDGKTSTSEIYLVNNDIHYYEAKVLVENGSYVSDGATGGAGLSGYFYNDSRGPGSGQDYNQHEGDVWLDIRIALDENGILKAKASGSRSDNADFSEETAILEQDFSLPINFDTEYLLSIELTDSEVVFKCNSEQLSYPLTSQIYEPYEKSKRLMSRVYADSGENGYMKVRFDDVCTSKGGAIYDDFESTQIDTAKWGNAEHIRGISNGKLRMGIYGSDQKTTISSNLLNAYTPYFESKVIIESGQVAPGATAAARLGGTFYNDSRGPGSGQPYNGDEGDVWLVIRIILDENNELTATTNIQRVDDANFETYTMLFEEDFSTPINFGTEYIFSIAVEDSKVVFKCNNETKIYQITTPIYLSHDKWRWLSTRVYADPGEPGYIKAEFDDVRITKSDKMTIHVPNDQPTIQAAIDAAKDGDTVIVHPGTYVENINFNGKNIVVASLAVTTGDIGYISETIIDGDQKGSVVSFNNGENSDALLNGFTITNGLAEDGGGINCNLSRPTLKNLIITDNMADNKGGGINISNDSYPDLEAVIIRDNSAKWGGGVNVSDDSDPDFLHIKIMNNTASEGGGGINIESSSSPDLKNVLIIKNSGRYGGGIRFSNISYHHSRDALDYITVADNSAEQGGGVFLADTSSYSALFERSIFWNNTPHQIYLGEYETVKSVSIRYSDIQDGEAGVVISSNGTLDGSRGNIDADPLFSDPENGDYLVAMDSPCRDSKSAIIMGVSPFPGEPGSLKWKFEEAEHRFDAAPAIGDDGTIYVGSMDGNIYAVAPNGILKWKFDTGAAWVNSSAAIGTDGTVYIVSKDLQEPSNEKLYAISPDGSLKWNFSMNTGDSSPVIGADGTIYIGSDDKKLYAINPDGTLKWEFQTVNGINASPAIGVDGTIYAGVYGKFYAINPDGTLKWELDEISLRSSPAIATDGTIYINSDDEILYAIHPDGTEKWKFKIGYRGGYSSPVIGSDGTVYVGSYDKNFYAINPDGTKKWEFQTTGGIHSSSALGDDGVIYVGSSAINPDGTLKWRFKTDSWSANTPTIGPDGVVYFGAWDLYAIYSDSHGPADSSWPMFLHDAKHTGRSERNTKVVSLLPDAPYNGTITSSKLNDFSFEATAGKMLLVEVVPQTGVHSLILDGSFGEVPLFSGFGDYTTGDMTVRNQYDLLIPKTDSGMYYFSVYGEHIENSGGSYTITARYVDSPYLSDMSRSSTLNQGSITLTVTGLGFNQATQVSLTGAGLSKLTPSELVVFSSTELLVSFDVEGIQPGIYSVQIGETGSISSVFNEFEIKSDGVPGHMRTVITAPAGVRTNREYSFEVEYQNDGETDLPVPLFVISNSLSGQMRLSELEARKQELIQVLGIIRENTATLRHVSPGRSGRFRGRFRVVPTPSQDVTITVEKMIADLTYIDWQKIESDIRPDDIDDDAWNIIWSNFKAQLGNTWQDYYRNLTDAGVYIGRYDWYKNTGLFAITGELFSKPYNDISQFEVGNLLAFEFAKASARLCPRSVLASAQDVFVPAPGLSLSFERFAFQSIESRFAQGAFGRGWTHAYDYTASIDEEKNVRIKAPNKSVRMFYYQNYNNYQGAAGDYGTVSLRSNNVVLREKDGAVWRFEANGKLSSIEDLNGNSLSFSYAGDELENITHSNGESIAITYDPNGKIYQITDPAGRTVTYTYDASGEHLVKVEESGGITTAYEYHLADGTASAHALKAITFPDKTRQYYSFDSKGRLAKEWRAGNTEVLTYTYDKQGTVTISDALGHSGLVRFGANGEILETRDPLGALAKISYNPQKQVTEIVHPDGNTTAVAYDAKGNPIGIRNPMNQLIQMNYEPEHSRLAKLTDSRSNETEFDYDERGNLQSITYPDASAESFEYDDFGNVSTYTNRRGNPIQYSFSTRGQITRKVYPDGRIIDYQYDTKGNLTGATDSLTGTISMEYDSRDFLTEIEYPGGYGFRFEYDSAGRRTKRISHDGDALGYHYDTAGRLQKLTDKNNEAIVQYEYDENGRLKREVKGNGTQTVYEYDPAGQLLSMINYSPGGAVQSRFDYAYDVNGNRTSMTTLNGTTSYQYDDMGQLVEVAYPDGREVIYEYDSAGNRISVTDNGVVTDYMTNNMNQYTHAGEASYTYDDDGNMISKTDTKGTTTYEYDAENRLIRVNTPSDGTWEYAYDAFGNRIRVNHNGTETRYVHDPIGLVDVAGEYD